MALNLISPEDWKKSKGKTTGGVKLTPTHPSKDSQKGTLNLISPEEWKAKTRSIDEDKQSINQPSQQSIKRMTEFVTTDPMQNLQKNRPELFKPAPTDTNLFAGQQILPAEPSGQSIEDIISGKVKNPEALKQIKSYKPYAGTPKSPADKAAQALSDFVVQGIDTAALNIPSAVLGDTNIKSTAGEIGSVAGQFIGFGKAYTLTKGLADAALKKGLQQQIEKELINAGIHSPRVARELARNTVASAAYSTAQQIADGTLDTNKDGEQGITERIKQVAFESVIGGAGGATIAGFGSIAKSGYGALKNIPKKNQLNQAIKDFIKRTEQPETGITPMPRERITGTITYEKPPIKVASSKYKQEYKQAIDDQYSYLKDSMKNRGGVDPGQLIRDETGTVINRVGRISNNPQWYQDFYKLYGRKPTNVDLQKLAKEHVDKGYQDDMTFIPPWRPKDIAEIDDELKSIQDMVSSGVDDETRVALQSVSDTLQKERDKLKRALPESVSAMPKKTVSGAVQPMATKTADGRPLLDRGPADVGTAVGKNITKRSDVIADIAKSLNIPIRTGRFRQKAHGIFKTKSSVVRSKLTNDVPVIAHEVGHALDKRYSLSSPQFDSELQKLGKETSGPNYTKDQVRSEGVAEFFRLLLTDPAKAQTSAPNFYTRFTQAVSQADKNALMKAQGQVRQYIDQDILNKSFSEISVGKRDKRKLPTLNDIYTKFTDDLNPIRYLLKPLGEKGKRVFENFWLLRGASGRAQAFLKQGRVDENFNVVGKSLDEIMQPVKANLNEARTYIKDKRALELEKRGIMTGSDLTPAERQRNVSFLEQQFPYFKQHHQDLKEYQDALLKELVDSGFLSADDVAKFKADNQEYVPFFRVYESEAGAGASKGGRTNVGSGAANLSSPIKRIKGSDREIIDLYESIIKNTYQYVTLAERNKATLSLIDSVVNAEGLGGLVEKVPTPMQGTKFTLEELRATLERANVDTGSLDMETMISIFRPANVAPGKDNIIGVFRNGKREFYQLDPELYRAVTAADKEQMNIIVRAANMPVRILRSGIVNTLEFWLRNVWRDQFSALVNSKNGYIPYIDLVRGMYHVLGKTDTFTKFLASGGAQSMRQSLDRKYLQADMRKLLAVSMKDKSMNVIKNPLEAMRALSELSELGTRVGEFSRGVKKDSSASGIKKSAVSARDLIDFGRAGTWGREINKVSAFWNAQMQGVDKTIRTLFNVKNPKQAFKSWVKATAFITAPTYSLYLINKDDPRYQELPDWDKDMYWHFWAGDKHFRIPIPFELGVLFKVLPERLMRDLHGEENAYEKLGQTAFNALNPIPTVTALMPWIQAYANQTFFGSPIVPKREESLLPEDQAGPYTSGVAKTIARLPVISDNYLTEQLLGSPRKVEHIIRGYTGSLGQYGTQLIDKATDVAGITVRPPKPKTGLEGWPGFKAIMGKPFGGNTDSMDKFYERVDKLTSESKSAAKKNEYYEGDGELKYLNKLQKEIGKVSVQIRDIQDAKDMTPQQKKEQIQQLNLMANNLARQGLNLEPLKYEDVFR